MKVLKGLAAMWAAYVVSFAVVLAITLCGAALSGHPMAGNDHVPTRVYVTAGVIALALLTYPIGCWMDETRL